jgi:hypothetical protein
LSLEEITASHAELQSDVSSFKEINGRIISEASKAALQYRQLFSTDIFIFRIHMLICNLRGGDEGE